MQCSTYFGLRLLAGRVGGAGGAGGEGGGGGGAGGEGREGEGGVGGSFRPGNHDLSLLTQVKDTAFYSDTCETK